MKRAHLLLTSKVLILSLLIMLTACSVGPQRATTQLNLRAYPQLLILCGNIVFLPAQKSVLTSVSETVIYSYQYLGLNLSCKRVAIRYKFKDGNEVKFDYSREGKYDRFATINEGRPRWFIRDESLQRSRTNVTNQAVYTQELVNNLKPGAYAYSRFLSPSRGLVDYSVYLPPRWKRNSSKTYPLVFFLHGQLGWEHSFPDSVPATQSNQWIAKGYIPPMVIVSLRTGRLKGRVEEQWSSARNESLLTSEHPNELRQFIRQQFRAGMTAKTTAIHGHSRGSRGAIHYALKYPMSFSSSVANAFVSDYALEETKQIAQHNLQQIRSQGIPLRISIGDRDEFALNMGRQASPVIHQFLNNLNIPHDYEVFPGVNHGFVNVWNARQKSGLPNGLGELQLHAGAWARL